MHGFQIQETSMSKSYSRFQEKEFIYKNGHSIGQKAEFGLSKAPFLKY